MGIQMSKDLSVTVVEVNLSCNCLTQLDLGIDREFRAGDGRNSSDSEVTFVRYQGEELELGVIRVLLPADTAGSSKRQEREDSTLKPDSCGGRELPTQPAGGAYQPQTKQRHGTWLGNSRCAADVCAEGGVMVGTVLL